MKALVLTAPRKLNLETVPDPTPQAHQAVVQVEFAGICGTDVEIYINDLMHYKRGYAKLPIIPGHEWTGTVVAVGGDVKNVKAGDRVSAEVAIGCGVCRWCRAGHRNVCPNTREIGIINHDGGFAQFACVPAANLRPTQSMEFRDSALAEPAAVVVNACRQGQVTYPDRVLIVGAGPIGLLSLQAARALGAEYVAVMDKNAERLALAKQLGADEILNAKDVSPETLPERCRALTAGEGFDVVLECAGAGGIMQALIESLARRGRFVIVGCYNDQRPAINPDVIINTERMLVGAVGAGNSFDDAIRLLREGKIKAPPLVTHTYALSEAPQLFANLAEHKGPQGALKVLLKP
ncbi:MAG TPA: alcohol dehydrogenase catalytic domain-containing protein [Planctomycetota bacterium]|nr:alcohol dehydrogenase catalytic domain-containing protein [Planctomycetota bacterium]